MEYSWHIYLLRLSPRALVIEKKRKAAEAEVERKKKQEEREK